MRGICLEENSVLCIFKTGNCVDNNGLLEPYCLLCIFKQFHLRNGIQDASALYISLEREDIHPRPLYLLSPCYVLPFTELSPLVVKSSSLRNLSIITITYKECFLFARYNSVYI